MSFATLSVAYEELRREAAAPVGGLGDLPRRAAVYRHLYRTSQGNHVFPVIAAHGALWAGGQFRFAMQIGRWLAWQYPWSAALRTRRLRQLAEFCDALREINRLVCIDTYAQFYLTRRFRDDGHLSDCVPTDLLGPLNTVHDACERRRPLSDAERRVVFEAHFRHEQETIVGERLERAASGFDWPLARWIALRPRIAFAYLPTNMRIPFRNFADKPERIRNGLRAFDLAAQVGWRRVEQSLDAYGIPLDAIEWPMPRKMTHRRQRINVQIGIETAVPRMPPITTSVG